MTCRDCAEFLSDYVSGDLPGEARLIFESHLERCANCATYLEQFRVTIQMTRTAVDDARDQAAELPEELIRAILAARKAV